VVSVNLVSALAAVRRWLPAPASRAMDAVVRVGARLAPERLRVALGPAHLRFSPRDVPPDPDVPQAPTRLYIGPANFAGQGFAWARAAERLPGVGAVSMAIVRREGFAFPVDDPVPEAVYAGSRRWQARRRALLPQFSHVIIEAGRPLLGHLMGADPFAEARWLRARGVEVAMLCHGSDIRLPSRHRELEPWSPFEPGWELTEALEAQVARFAAGLEGFAGPVLVSTPDLLLDVPRATWLPVVVDAERWRAAGSRPPLEREVPVVVHAPSSAHLKGTALIEPVLERLDARGVIEYRRIAGVPPARMAEVYGEADVVLDQFRIGNYGVAACEAMAAGRLVVSHVSDSVRTRAEDAAGAALPILEATPDSLEDVLVAVLGDRPRARALAEQGPGFVRALHDGERAAEVLGHLLA